MKKTIYSISFLVASLLFIGCNNDDSTTTEEFDDANGTVTEKLIKSLSATTTDGDDLNIEMSYNSDGSLNTINDGESNTIFVYESEELTSISGSNDNLSVEELYGSPYDAFETGYVNEYDDNGNPIEIRFYEEAYNNDLEEYETVELTALISYDDAPNPFFYTLKAAGIIDVLDNVSLNMGINMQASEVISAKQLFPLNNISKIEYKNENNEVEFTIDFNYIYDADNYPTSATVISTDGSDQETITSTFTYVE